MQSDFGPPLMRKLGIFFGGKPGDCGMDNRIDRRRLLQLMIIGAGAARLGFSQIPRQHSLVLVTNSEGNDIDVIDLERLTVTGDWNVGDHPHGIAVAGNGRVAYTTIESEHTLKCLDCLSGKVLNTLQLPGRPNQCAVTPNGKFVAVPIFDGDSVQIVDGENLKILKNLPVAMPHNCLNA